MKFVYNKNVENFKRRKNENTKAKIKEGRRKKRGEKKGREKLDRETHTRRVTKWRTTEREGFLLLTQVSVVLVIHTD